MRITPRRGRPPVIVLAALAVIAAVVVTGCSTGSHNASSSASSAAGSAAGVPKPVGIADAPNADSAAGANGSGASGTAAAPVDIASTAQIKTADMTVAATDVNAAATTAIQYATAAGGSVFADVRTTATPGNPASASAQLTLKVLPDQLEATLTRLASLGVERSRQSSSQDVTGQVADVDSRVTSAQASIARLQSLFGKATSIGDIVSLEGQLAQRQAQLESLQAQQRALAAQTTFATVNLNLVAATAPVVRPKSADRDGFLGGLGGGWHAFTDALRWGLTVLGAVLPFVALALLALVIWRLTRRRLHPRVPAE